MSKPREQAGSAHTQSHESRWLAWAPARHCLPRAEGEPPLWEGVTGLHAVSLAHVSVVVINTSTGIVTARSVGPVWGQSETQTHTASLCRGREVTSWSPENARLRGTNGQVPELPAFSGNSACLAGLPSHSADASELPSAPLGRRGKGRGCAERPAIDQRLLPPSLLPPRIPGLQPAGQPCCLRKQPAHLGRAAPAPDPALLTRHPAGGTGH